MEPLFPRLDHLVYATPDLEASQEEFEQRLGVRPALGGRHPQWATRNAVLALGPRTYLEIIGPDPKQPAPPGGRPFALDARGEARLVTWVARARDLPELVAEARRNGVELGAVRAGTRQHEDGSTLSWTMTDLFAAREGGLIPYFIDWGGSIHPAQTSPPGCTLTELRGEHPHPEAVAQQLSRLDLDLEVTYGREVALFAEIDSPRGRVGLC